MQDVLQLKVRWESHTPFLPFCQYKMSLKSLLLGYLDFIFKNAYKIYNLLHNICIHLNKTNLSLPISGQESLTNPHLPTQCSQPTWDMPWGQYKQHRVPEGEPFTFEHPANKRLQGGVRDEDLSLAPLPQLPPILDSPSPLPPGGNEVTLQGRNWLGTSKETQSFSKKTQVLGNTSLSTTNIKGSLLQWNICFPLRLYTKVQR